VGLGDELRAALMLCGCTRVVDLNTNRVVIGGRLLEWIQQRDLKMKDEKDYEIN
jgi:isopentenyl diphosphate isomerase/L-lactate dehydrogenase-like FMN-dependent dehydrogenase